MELFLTCISVVGDNYQERNLLQLLGLTFSFDIKRNDYIELISLLVGRLFDCVMPVNVT